MPSPDDRPAKMRELEETIRILQLENDQLAGRAEDSLLLGLISEQISKAETIAQVLEFGLERISVLKDIPFCACCSRVGDRAEIVKAYLSFTDEDLTGRKLELPEGVLCTLAGSDRPLVRGGERPGLSIDLKSGPFVPLAALWIPFSSQVPAANLFFFGDDKADGRLAGGAEMLHRVTEMLVSRMDNLALLQALQELNRDLDRQVEARTRELRQSETRFRQFFENQAEYCYMVSPEGLILDVNRAALEVLAYRKEDLVGRPIRTIYAPESRARADQALVQWKASGRLSAVELVIQAKDGRKRTVLLSADLVRTADGQPSHSISVQQDITERKRAEEGLRRLNEDLEQRVRERTAELEAKNAELERLNKVFIGRELRMVELKKRIKDLESGR